MVQHIRAKIQSPKSCLFIGDSNDDVLTAQKLNMVSVYIGSSHATADYVVPHIEDLIDRL